MDAPPETASAGSAAPPQDRADAWSRGKIGRVLVGTALALVALALVVHVSPWAARDFGVSHDGYNGAMWGLGARGALEDPIGNRLGGIQSTGDTYANHPPLLVWTEAGAVGLAGGSPLAMRLPVLLASLAALAMIALLLRDAGSSPSAAAAGVVVAGTTGMFLTYGALIDTPMLSLPFGLAALAAAQRSWQGRPPRRWVLVSVGALAALSGWQAALVAALAATTCLIGPNRTGRGAGRRLALGVATGTLTTLAWILWSHGSLQKLADQAALRAGPGTDWSSWLDRQVRFLGDLYGWPVVGLVVVGTTVALLWPTATAAQGFEGDAANGTHASLDGANGRRAEVERGNGAPADVPRGWMGVRPLVVVVAITIVGYTVGFREASAVHDYWTYWGVALVALAVAALVDGVRRASSGASRPVSAALSVGLVAVVVALAATGAARRSDADAAIQEGLDAVPVLEAAARAEPEGQGRPLVVRNAYETLAPWADWATRRPAELPTPEELTQLDGDRLLFIRTADAPTPPVLDLALAHQGRYVLLRVADYRALVGG